MNIYPYHDLIFSPCETSFILFSSFRCNVTSVTSHFLSLLKYRVKRRFTCKVENGYFNIDFKCNLIFLEIASHTLILDITLNVFHDFDVKKGGRL